MNMNISFKTILFGMFETEDADMIIVVTITTMLTQMRNFWYSAREHSEDYARLYSESEKHFSELWRCLDQDSLPIKEDEPSRHEAVKDAMKWVIDNLEHFYI